MWYNLLYIELKIKIEGKKYHHIIFIENVIKEELLWDKRNKEPNDIKKIMAEIIRRNLLNEENPSEYKKGITYVTLDLLDYYSELATKVVLDQIYFYDKFHPELFIKKGLFQNFEENNGNISEFIIPLEINVNIEGINYNDNLNWDLLDIELIPETFAENTVKDENLPNKFILPIAYQIRKGIHNYVFNLFKNFVKNFEKYEQNYFLGEEKINKATRQADDLGKNIPIFIFDAKLSQMLGKKRKINENMNEDNLPSFLLNKKDDKNNNELKKIKKMMNSSTKKISNKKNKNMNMIEHDKQSTTMDENE